MERGWYWVDGSGYYSQPTSEVHLFIYISFLTSCSLVYQSTMFLHFNLHVSLFSLCWLQELESPWLAEGGDAKSEHSLQQRVQQWKMNTNML